MTGIRVPTVEEALRTGESQSVEFKQGLSEDEGKTGAVEHVAFEDVRALLVAKITDARGEAPVYMMGGVIYIRDGSADCRLSPRTSPD